MKRTIVAFSVLLLGMGAGRAQQAIDRETLVYSVKEGRELHIDKYESTDAGGNGLRPVLIYVHGGGFATGSRVNALQILYGKHFVERGFVAFAIDYRLGLQEVPGQEATAEPDPETITRAVSMAVEDLIDATAFILSKADSWRLDPEKILISGGSAGAITCLTAEYDLCATGRFADRLPAGFRYGGIVSHAGCVIAPGDTLTWTKAPCPMLLMHGNIDQLVPFDRAMVGGSLYAGSAYLRQQLLALGVPHWLYEEAGADHIVALKPLQDNFGTIDTFIDRFVLAGEQASVHTVWRDKEPDSMDKMFEVVPLYIQGWDKTDEELGL